MNFKKLLNKTKLSVAILATLSVFILGCINTPKAFALSMNGSGTTSDPYIITSAEQLSEIRDNLSASYKLANDINLDGIDFIPIGNKDVPFTGTFDGSGYTIKNLKINQPNGYYVGLFGGTNKATINNLNISDANVVGKSHTGGLIGYSSDSNGKSTIISNCSVTGSSTVTGGPYTGGLVGYSINSNTKSTISNCSVTGSSTVTGGSYTGGLVGYGSGLIEKSFATTNVVSGTHVGGLVGTAESLTINECFTTGNIKALNTVGGLVGSSTVKLKMENCYSLSNIEATHPSNSYAGGLFGISKDKNNTINCCYFAGTIKGGESYKGALVGNTLNVINNSFYDGVKSNLAPKKSYEMCSRLTTGMARQQSYTDWNFDTIWAIDENASYPYLKNLSKPSNVNMILPLKDVETGTGSIDNPYIISTKEQLNNVKFDLTANYKLANDIDLKGIDFVPIGNKEAPFIGTFDGNGYTIQNLKINQPNGYYVGLFGGINNATIKNLNISDANVVGGSYTGGLVGYSNGKSTISNCSVNGSSTVTGGSYTGGLVGYGSGLIEKSFATTSVVGHIHVGGLVGTAESLTINECFTTGNIKALNIVGGLVGSNIEVGNASELKMNNCYSLSNIEATHNSTGNAGGLLGLSKKSTINNCYFAGTIKGAEAHKGALVGNNNISGDIINSFYDGVKVNLIPKKSYEMFSRLTTGMAKQQSYTDWNFDTIWAIDENASYPYLKSLSKPSNVNMILPLKDVEAGTGSIDNPYIISTKDQLKNVRFDLTANYKLANDIDLEGIDFLPIGHKGALFIGIFDGNGYTIKNLKINQPNEDYVGLFGGICTTIKNLNISDANVVGGSYTGGLVGYSDGYYATISNCSVTGSSTITGNHYYTGGLVGYGSGLIEKSFTTTNVTSHLHAGGLVGTGENLRINECFTTGNIKALNRVGGLVGSNTINLQMENCYSLSNIEATHNSTANAGGLLGFSQNKNIINCCYFAGTIKGAESGKGGLLGKTSASIGSSFYDASVIGFTSSSPYAKSTSEMMQSDTFINWDFNNIWSIDEGATYPYFKKYANTTPINLTATSNDNIVELSWNIVSNVKNYEVKRSLTAGGPYTTVATVPADTNNYSDNDVIGGTTYYYIITALNSLGGQSNSNEVTVTPNIPKTNDLDAPTITSLVRDGGVYISWNEVENATSYNVKRSLTPGGPYTNLLDTPTNGCRFWDRSADKEIKYYYVVTAVNDNGESINSKEMCSDPRDLTIQKVGDTIALGWFILSEDTSYSIKRSTTPNGPYTYIATDINATGDYAKFDDNNTNTGNTYFYVVETKLSSGEVQASQEISITP
ncbi:GLUG motif-containing protein [Clostridium sp.]|uniref:GLUG motif-containing protein n=1 Tax=Clostridium sp. TaxID=1506 RepID=UPI003217BE0B